MIQSLNFGQGEIMLGQLFTMCHPWLCYTYRCHQLMKMITAWGMGVPNNMAFDSLLRNLGKLHLD
jgi:hypothetical protein